MKHKLLLKFLNANVKRAVHDFLSTPITCLWKPKFAPFYFSWVALSVGILFCQSQNFQILAENHGL